MMLSLGWRGELYLESYERGALVKSFQPGGVAAVAESRAGQHRR